MKPTKILFNTDIGTFGVRAEGVMLKGNQVLLHQPETFDFWTFPGGGVHLHETLQETLVREWNEETGFDIEVKRLLYIIENFFIFKGNQVFPGYTADGRVHGYGFCFLVEPKETEGEWLNDEFYGQEDIPYQGRNLRITFRWFSPDELDSINLVPVCLKEALKNIPDQPIHIVDREV
ncbi:MAG: NUDIX hydrolase [Candidatus Thorarchaeota archaeon]